MAFSIWLFDPANLTAYYDAALGLALAQAGHRVRLVSSRFGYDELPLPTHPNLQIDTPYIQGWRRYPQLRKIARALQYPLGHRMVWRNLRRTPPDIFHLQWSRIPTVDKILLKAIRRRGIPIVMTVHEVAPLFAMADNQLGEIYALADALIVHSHANQHTLLTQHPRLAPAKVVVIPHLDMASVVIHMPAQATQSEARRLLGIPPDAFVFGYVGTFKAYKGIPDLINAFAALNAHHTHLILAGYAAPDADPIHIPDNIQKRVSLYQGYFPHNEAWMYHLAPDVLVFPFRQVYQSGSLLTAMAYGKPIISTRVGSIPETVIGNGWLADPQNSTSLRDAMQQAAHATDAERQAMAKTGLARLHTHHHPQQIAQLHSEVYARV